MEQLQQRREAKTQSEVNSGGRVSKIGKLGGNIVGLHCIVNIVNIPVFMKEGSFTAWNMLGFYLPPKTEKQGFYVA